MSASGWDSISRFTAGAMTCSALAASCSISTISMREMSGSTAQTASQYPVESRWSSTIW